jgi:hypothetical protein
MELNGTLGRFGASAVTASIIAMTMACGGQSLTTGPSATPSAPSTPTNTAPTIRALTLSAQRIEAGDQVALSADVTETSGSPDMLDYAWSASPAPGQFIGSGPHVTWQAPAGQHSPDVYTITLVVTEMYRQDGALQTSKATSSVQIHYNDSHAETQGVALAYLNDSASSDVTPAQVVRNFSNACPGKAQQLAAIESERQNYQMLGGDFSVDVTEFYQDRTTGDVVAPCVYKRKSIASGETQTTSGTCLMTTVYENWRWMLCDSRVATDPAAAAALRKR